MTCSSEFIRHKTNLILLYNCRLLLRVFIEDFLVNDRKLNGGVDSSSSSCLGVASAVGFLVKRNGLVVVCIQSKSSAIFAGTGVVDGVCNVVATLQVAILKFVQV